MAIELERYASLLRQKLEIASDREAPVEARDVFDQQQQWAARQKKLKAENPNHGAPWRAADDAKLVRMHSCGMTVTDISKCMGRNSGAIRSRLDKIQPTEALQLAPAVEASSSF